MSTILSEQTISFHDGCRLLPPSRNGKPVCFATVWRWAIKGVLSQSGERVRLEAVRLGGRWITSREAIARFSAALTGETAAPSPIRTPAARKRASEAARKKLEAIGI